MTPIAITLDSHPDSRRRAVVVVQHAAQTLATLHGSTPSACPFPRHEQTITQTLVVSLAMIQLSNTTPILGMSVKSGIRGIHGTAGQYGYMPPSSNGAGW